MKDQEREAARESLKQIAESDGSATERGRAETALIELGVQLVNGSELSAPSNPADSMAEAFLLQQQVDPLSGRFLRQTGRATFLNVRDTDIAVWMQSEWSRETDEKVHDEKYKRLRTMRDAASEVQMRYTMTVQDINPLVCELLGVDTSGGPDHQLDEGKKKYAKVAALDDVR